MKVSELEGAELDYWVAKTQDPDADYDLVLGGALATVKGWFGIFTPSKRWDDCGPLIDQFEISIGSLYGESWAAGSYMEYSGPDSDSLADLEVEDQLAEGCTALEAACRAIVTLRFGDEVPDE